MNNLDLSKIIESNPLYFIVCLIGWIVAVFINMNIGASMKGIVVVLNRSAAAKKLPMKTKVAFYTSGLMILLLGIPVGVLFLYLLEQMEF